MTNPHISARAGKATTHGALGAGSVVGGEDRQRLGGARLSSQKVRAAWRKFRVAERRFSDSIWGDLVGGLAFVSIVVWAMYYIPLAYAPQDRLPHVVHIDAGGGHD